MTENAAAEAAQHESHGFRRKKATFWWRRFLMSFDLAGVTGERATNQILSRSVKP